MKKKRLFSRIFAAVLAVAIAAVTLITNSGAGLSVFADGEEAEATAEDNGSGETYSVKIISPDVPADGKTYSYNFYQIIAGDVEDDNGVNIIANPSWGAALGEEDFDNVPEEKTPVGGMGYEDEDAGIGYYPTSEVLLTALSGTMSCEQYARDTTVPAKKCPVLESAYDEYCKILKSYGVSYNTNGYIDADGNYFFKKFNYAKTNDSYVNLGKTRDAKGLVELLNAGSSDKKLKTANLRAFADLLLNGVDVKVKTDSAGTIVGSKYKFITTEPQATQNVKSDDNQTEYTVENLAPGYYLVTCEDEGSTLTNDGYEKTMPIKPVSTMLILVGPANEGVTEIVGKNAYSVPTVTLDIYQKPVQLKNEIETNDTSLSNGYENEVNEIDDIIKKTEDNWKNTGSFDCYEAKDRNEAILYRIGITLPMNFDKYSKSGYFLAVLDQYNSFFSSSKQTHSNSDGEIVRVTNVRPYVYVMERNENKNTLVGRCCGNAGDNGGKIKTTCNSIDNVLSGGKSKNIYNVNQDLGSSAHDIFCFGNLYDYTKQGEDTNSEAECIFHPGDTIYIYYPAILNKTKVHYNKNYLLNANRIWAVYSNNPYADKLEENKGYSHVVNGEVGVTPIAEANVNTYEVKLTVDGESEYTDGAKFALYKEVGEGNNKTKEYAYTYTSSNGETYVKEWISESVLRTEIDNNSTYTTIKDVLLNGYESKISKYLAGTVSGIKGNGVTIRGLAAGEYYLQELTISSSGVNYGTGANIEDSNHGNIKSKHYKLAKEPIRFKVYNKYNESVSGYLDGNQNTFIKELTVEFLQDDNPERAIDTYIIKPCNIDEEDNSVFVENGSITTTLNENSTKYATVDGKIEIQVYHKTINLIWLPETGGIGTMIFFIVGGMIVVMATVLIVTRFRVKREWL